MTENNECAICTQHYTQKLRAKISCLNTNLEKKCNFHACKQCIQIYIKSKPQIKPHCMGCKTEFEDSFIIEQLNKSFLRGDLKSQKNKLILEDAHSKLVQIMPKVEIYLQNKETENNICILSQDFHNQHYELKLKYNKIKKLKINDDLNEYIKENMNKDEELTEFLKNPIYEKHDTNMKGLFSLFRKHFKYMNEDILESGLIMERDFVKKFIKIRNITFCNNNMLRYLNTNDELNDYSQIIFMNNISSWYYNTYYKNNIKINRLLKYNYLIFSSLESVIYENSSKYSANPDMKLKGKALQTEFNKEYQLIYDSYMLNLQILKYKAPDKKERKQFVMKCPGDDCRGFLSMKYKCDICKVTVCSKCRLIKKEDHECKKEDIESTELIKKETKGCPKCGVPIYKTSGCDQMWCPQCQVAFSWRTGNIETGVNHNPHYFQWMREQGTQVRTPGDMVCGGLVNLHILNNHLKNLVRFSQCEVCKTKRRHNVFCEDCTLFLSNNHPDVNENTSKTKIFELFCEENNIKIKLYKIHRGLGDLTPILNEYRRIVQENNNIDQISIYFIVKELTKKQFERTVLNKANKREKVLSYLHVIELYNTLGIEEFVNLVNTHIDEISIDTLQVLLEKIEVLRKYTNDLLIKTSKGYTGNRVNINENFLFEHVK